MARPKKEKPNRSDGRYEIRKTIGTDYAGKPIRKSFYSRISKEDALRQYEEYLISEKVADITGIGQADSNITFGKWAEIWLEKYKRGSVKENTFEKTYLYTVNTHLLPALGAYKLTSISQSDLQLFMNRKAELYSDTLLKKIANCLYSIYDRAIDNNLCLKNPAKNLIYKSKKEKTEKNTYSEEEVEILLNFAATHQYGLYIRILLELGLRCSELCGLRWEDFDFKKKTVYICRASTGINGRVTIAAPKSKTSIRMLPLTSSLSDFLAEVGAGKTGYICATKYGGPFEVAGFTRHRYDVFFSDMKNEGISIPRLSPHEMRHTCGTLLYRKTGDLYAVSKYMGHAGVEITAKYYIHDDENLLRNHLKID